jgi:hypothetical protein
MLVRTIGHADVRGNLYILPALAYAIGISVYYLLYGVSLNPLPTLLFLGAVSIMAVLGSSRKMGKYWISIISVMLSYEALQGAVGSLAASRGVFSLYSVDRLIWGST